MEGDLASGQLAPRFQARADRANRGQRVGFELHVGLAPREVVHDGDVMARGREVQRRRPTTEAVSTENQYAQGVSLSVTNGTRAQQARFKKVRLRLTGREPERSRVAHRQASSWPAGASPTETLHGDPPQGEPAVELGLDRKLVGRLRLEHQLTLVVACIGPPRGAGGGEGIEEAALVVIDPVERTALGVLE